MDPETIRIKAALFTAEVHIIKRIERKLKRARALQRAWLAKKVAETPRDTLNALDQQFVNIYEHRIKVVRPEARRTHLARMFMRDVPYETVEKFAHSKPDWDGIFKVVKRFTEAGSSQTWLQDLTQRYAQWQQEGTVHSLAARISHEAKRLKDEPMHAANLATKKQDHEDYKVSPNRPQIAANMKQQYAKAA